MFKKYNRLPQWDLQQLQQNFNGITENTVFPEYLNEKGNYQPQTLIDETLETIDPTPNIHTMFVQFNEQFFWNKLLPVQVRWSQRMTTCAGTCSFHPRNRECIIALSAPLLKFRPRKDLVETLLHEMIHSYLFLTNNNRDRDGHGPEFCKHMNRINQNAGTNITIYHSFHDEVRLYQQHWWRCNGPCQKRAPYFGTVRRAINRPPGPSDFWFKNHQMKCGGEFIKVREPESKPKNKNKKFVKPPELNNTMDRYITLNNSKNSSPAIMMNPSSLFNIEKTDDKIIKINGLVTSDDASSSSNFNFKGYPCNQKVKTPPGGIIKVGTVTINNVYGFGTGEFGKSSSSQSKYATPKSKLSGKVNFTGKIVGGKATGKSNLLDKFLSLPAKQISKNPEIININSIQCPVCNTKFSHELIDNHIDTCLAKKDHYDTPPSKRTKISNTIDNNHKINKNSLRNNENFHTCPICHEKFLDNIISIHVDECLLKQNIQNTTNDQSVSAVLRDCPICNNFFVEDEIFNHVNKCLIISESKNKKNKQKTDAIINQILSSPIKDDKTDNNNIKCPICSQNIKMADYIVHVETCPAAAAATEYNESHINKDNIIILDDDTHNPGSSKQKDDSIGTYACLVCNAMISKSIPLHEHLDYCVSITHCDEPITETKEKKNSCPICMRMIEESLIAQHVDECITHTQT